MSSDTKSPGNVYLLTDREIDPEKVKAWLGNYVPAAKLKNMAIDSHVGETTKLPDVPVADIWPHVHKYAGNHFRGQGSMKSIFLPSVLLVSIEGRFYLMRNKYGLSGVSGNVQ